MRPGREIDTLIAKNIFGHRVWAQSKILFENAEKGDRPLRHYSREIEWASEVVQRMKITLLPIEGGQWFAFVGPEDKRGWESPQAVLEFLNKGEFDGCGACVGDNLPLIICEAALKAAAKRTAVSDATQSSVLPPTESAPSLATSGPTADTTRAGRTAEKESLQLVADQRNSELRH